MKSKNIERKNHYKLFSCLMLLSWICYFVITMFLDYKLEYYDILKDLDDDDGDFIKISRMFCFIIEFILPIIFGISLIFFIFCCFIIRYRKYKILKNLKLVFLFLYIIFPFLFIPYLIFAIKFEDKHYNKFFYSIDGIKWNNNINNTDINSFYNFNRIDYYQKKLKCCGFNQAYEECSKLNYYEEFKTDNLICKDSLNSHLQSKILYRNILIVISILVSINMMSLIISNKILNKNKKNKKNNIQDLEDPHQNKDQNKDLNQVQDLTNQKLMIRLKRSNEDLKNDNINQNNFIEIDK